MERVCFQLQVRPECMEEYKARHAAVWPDMLLALCDAGWENYSLFLRADGLLIGYFETKSLSEALRLMASAEVNARWQSEMSPMFESLGDQTPDAGFVRLPSIFNLAEQIAATQTTLGGLG